MTIFFNSTQPDLAPKSSCSGPRVLPLLRASLLRAVPRLFLRIVMRKLYILACLTNKRSGLLLLFKFKGRPDILEAVQPGREVMLASKAFLALPSLPVQLTTGDGNPFKASVRLASRSVPFSPDLYVQRFDDDEDTMAVHRFSWFLVLIHENPTEQTVRFCLDQIQLWCSRFPEPDDGLIFGTYSISERLVAWLQVLMIAKTLGPLDNELAQVLTASYKKQLFVLIRNLEYHGTWTNNHILNNARALYLCGSLLHIHETAALGKMILFKEGDLFIQKGALLEGSSHYQMLLTRSFLEIYHAARQTRDTEVLEWITSRLPLMLRTCTLLQSRFDAPEYPLFGDISPDVDPDWMRGYPFSTDSRTASPWQEIFKLDVSELVIPGDDPPGFDKNRPWNVITNGSFEVWVIGKSVFGSHGHNDNGSIVVFHRGMPVIVDPGLSDYRRNKSVCQWQIRCSGHNTPELNHRCPDFDRFSVFQEGVISSSFRVLTNEDSFLQYELDYLQRAAVLTRSISFDSSGLLIEDRARAVSDRCSYHANWHLAGSLRDTTRKSDSTNLIFDSGLILVIQTGAEAYDINIENNRRSLRYGDLQPVCTIGITSCLRKQDSLMLRFTFDRS